LNNGKNGPILTIALVFSNSQTYQAFLHPNDHWPLDISCTPMALGVQKGS
jgi:hypothetical protein